MLKGRLEDDRMLTGRGRYVSDWNLPGQAHAHFVRSDRAHAEIVSIDKEAAAASPGVLAVFTGEDLKALKSLPAALPAKGRGGSELVNPGRPALAQGRVRFAGDAVALVVAESAVAAQDAAELVSVEYRELPAVITAGEAVAPGAPLVHQTVPGNIVLDFESGDEALTQKAFKNAARVVRLSVHNSRVVGNPMEPRACLAAYLPEEGMYHLYACTQGAPIMRNQLSAVLGVPPEKIRVIAEEVGGGFGVRFNLYPEYCAALFAAKALGRPVKWTGTRSEVFLADEQARDVLSQRRARPRRLRAHRRDAFRHAGQPRRLPRADRSLHQHDRHRELHLRGLRRAGDLRAHPARAHQHGADGGLSRRGASGHVVRDRAAGGACGNRARRRRGRAAPQELHPDKPLSIPHCRRLRVRLRRLRGGSAKGARGRGLGRISRKKRSSEKRGRLLGRGMSTYIEATGAGFAPQDQVELRWNFGEMSDSMRDEASGTLTLYAPTHNHGQGQETSFAQVVTRELGVPLESVRLRTAGPEFYLTGNATGGSRSLLAVGSVLMLAAREMVKKGLSVAAEELEAAQADIEFSAGSYRIKGTDRAISIQSLAQRRPGELDIAYANKFGATFPNGCHIAEVEIDPETGEAEIASYVACDDAGNIVNHQIVEGQMQGGLTQGAGQVFNELAVYDRESGQLLTGSFMDYAMPRAGLVSNLKLLEHPVPTQLNPLGAKGVGEAGVTGSLPALMNAVVDALRSAGVRHFELPATPQRVWQALRAAGS